MRPNISFLADLAEIKTSGSITLSHVSEIREHIRASDKWASNDEGYGGISLG